MLDVMVGIPPITHGTTMTPGEAITALVIIGVFVALVMVASYLLGVAGYRRVQRQSQMKEVERPEEASQQPRGRKQPAVRAPVRLPNLT